MAIYNGSEVDDVYTGTDEIDTIYGNGGKDRLNGSKGEDFLYGGDDDDTLEGGEGDDNLYGDAGDDVLDGGPGNDQMRGGEGNDLFMVDASTDWVSDDVTAGSGYDTVIASVSFVLNSGGEGIERLILTGTDGINGTGNALNNIIIGNSGDNSLFGLVGNDRLDGGAGADSMVGGEGDDTYVVENAGDVVNEYPYGTGNDTVEAWISYALTNAVEVLKLMGSAAINGTGNLWDNQIIGNDAANIIDGGAGADIMIGGLGDDLYYVDQPGDIASEYINGGYDTVRASISYSLAGYYTEALILTGSATINGTGNSLANALTGNSAANTLDGREGNDVIDGGGGIDTMTGGLGDDVFYVGQAGDLAIEANGEGNDTVYAAVNYSLSGQYIENLILTGGAVSGTGNKLANVLTGNNNDNTLNGGEGSDTIDGGAGNDTMIGGLGDDIFYVSQAGDLVFEYNGEGTDSVYASVSFSLAGQFIENLTLTGGAAINGTGNKLANVLTGNAAANVLNGGDGNDALHGGLGADTLTGGAGADGFWFDTAIGGGNVDSITDFNVAADTIHLDRSIFTGLAADGVLDANAFAYGTTAQDADDRILYDAATGNIYYDADGTGGAAAVLIAQVPAGTALTNGDFFGQP